MFEQQKNELDKVLQLLKKNEDKATAKVVTLSKELYRFVNHPVIEKNENLEAIEKYLNLMQRRLKVKFESQFEIVPVSFVKGERKMPTGVKRNLFNYESY
jgi:LytS/YehU family sensor histidine kinase